MAFYCPFCKDKVDLGERCGCAKSEMHGGLTRVKILDMNPMIPKKEIKMFCPTCSKPMPYNTNTCVQCKTIVNKYMAQYSHIPEYDDEYDYEVFIIGKYKGSRYE